MIPVPSAWGKLIVCGIRSASDVMDAHCRGERSRIASAMPEMARPARSYLALMLTPLMMVSAELMGV